MTAASREVVDGGGALVARVVCAGDLWTEPGLSFWTSDDDFVQVGTWNHPGGTHLNAHIHNTYERCATRTQEVVFLLSGSVQAHIYDDEGLLLVELSMAAGDLLICFAGGHGYTITSEGTRVLEIKNGPYFGPDKDRRRLY